MGKLDNSIPGAEDETPNIQGFPWSELHVSIVCEYSRDISRTCDIGGRSCASFFDLIVGHDWPPRSSTIIQLPDVACLAQDIRDVFMVPRLNNFHQSQDHRIKKHQLVEVFITFLLRLLCHKTDSIVNPREDQTNSLEKELRFLLTILGDISWMLCDDIEHEEFQNLLAEFEAVANEAGAVVHSLVSYIDRATIKRLDEGLNVVLNHIDLLKANIRTFLNLLSSISRSACITPKTSVVDSLLIVDSLIYELEDLMNQEDNRIADVKDQIRRLYQGLIVTQSSIKYIGSPQPSEIGELKQPLMRIGDMARGAEYLIICFLVGDAPLWYIINRLTDINHNIQLIGSDVLEIITREKIGGLKFAKYSSAQLSLPAKRNLEVNNATVGFEDKVIHILDQLVGGTERLHVISIFGMPGLGKTTLAKKLYNHPTVNYHFDKLSWCVVSQTYQRGSTLADILIHIASELFKERILKMEEESLVEHIYKTLKGRRYLIVMDDIWDSNVWDDLWRCFPDDGNGSRILFTTRNKYVAPPNCIIYALPLLSDDQCWELLEKKAFGNKPCPPELIGIGKKIAANCCGLPLAVVVIAGILSTMDMERGTWEEVEGNLASYIFDDRDGTVMQILELSYKHLPEYLKPCFLYFGAVQKGKEIRIGRLMRLWIAEAFIHKEEGKSAENVAEEYLMELIDRSLVMVIKRRSDGGVKTCAIHDLLADLCLKRSKEENFLKFVDDDIYSIDEEQQLLNLLSYYGYAFGLNGHNYETTPISYFRASRFQRVLHCNYLKAHFIGIECLVYLRYLTIYQLPASIGSLVSLEYLLVKTDKMVRLPRAILKMKKLRYINVHPEAVYDRDCTNYSSETNNVEFLSRFAIGHPWDEEMLKCSPRLRKLKIRADLHFDLSFLTLLESLKVESNAFLTFLQSVKLGANYPEIEKIRFPANIRKLTLSESWLPGEMMSIIGRLEKLEVLKLQSVSFEDKIWDSRDGEFQKLRFLKLDQIRNLTQWNIASNQHFPKLQQLILSDCCNLEEIPCEIGEIATLQLIEVQGQECPKSLQESAQRIQQEQWDMANDELKVIISRTGNYF